MARGSTYACISRDHVESSLPAAAYSAIWFDPRTGESCNPEPVSRAASTVMKSQIAQIGCYSRSREQLIESASEPRDREPSRVELRSKRLESCAHTPSVKARNWFRSDAQDCLGDLVVRPYDLVITLGRTRAWTPARQPVWRPALHSSHYRIMRSWY